MLNRINIQATDFQDAWFQLVYEALKHGREFHIDKGSYAGQTRLEFDWVDIHILNPGLRCIDGLPLIPMMPEGSTIPAPVTKDYVRAYPRYIMTAEKEPGESYTYGERLWAALAYKHYESQESKWITAEELNQVEHIINNYRNHGHRNNQMVLQVAQPSDLKLEDPPCVLPGSRITTNAGIIPIEMVQIGDMVLTHTGRWKKVIEKHQRFYQDTAYSISTVGPGHRLGVTKEHPVLSHYAHQCPYDVRLTCKHACKKRVNCYGAHGKKCPQVFQEYGLDWVPAKDIKSYSMLAVPTVDFTLGELPEPFKAWSEDHYFLLGLWLAEGDYSDGLRFSCGNHAKGVFAISEIQRIASKHGLGSTGKVGESGNTLRTTIYSRPLEELYRQYFNHLAHQKQIPFALLFSEPTKIRKLIEGFCLGDGHTRCDGRKKSLATTSPYIKDFFVAALLQLGIEPCVRVLVSKEGCIDGRKISGGREYYVVDFTDPRTKSSGNWFLNGVFHVKIKDVFKFEYSGAVYNLDVEDDHSYVCEGIAVHNCLRHIDTRIQDGKLHFFPYFRSWDLWGGFPANLTGISTLQEYMAAEIGVEQGEMICTSKGLHLYGYAKALAELRTGLQQGEKTYA